MANMNSDEHEIYQEFKKLVNMTPPELQAWLNTDDSQSVGVTGNSPADKKTEAGGEESIGHNSGVEIANILKKSESDFSAEDYQHMKKVNGYIKRHLAQKPSSDIEHSRWRYSLMNWGHDPLK